MKLGSKEWFDELNKRVLFPSVFSFYYNKQDNTIHVLRYQGKAKVPNIRYQDIGPSPLAFHPPATALIQVKEILDDKAYYEEMVRLCELWGISHD